MSGINPEILLESMKQYANGNFSAHIELDSAQVRRFQVYNLSALLAFIYFQGQYSETYIEIAEVFNSIVSASRNRQDDLNRVIHQVLEKGDFSVRMNVEDAKGGWRTNTTSINTLIENLTQPIIEVTGIIQAVSNGDLSGTPFRLQPMLTVIIRQTQLPATCTEGRLLRKVGSRNADDA